MSMLEDFATRENAGKTSILFLTVALGTALIAAEARSLFGDKDSDGNAELAQPDEPLTTKNIRQLIKDLGDEDFMTREAAFGKLMGHTHEPLTMKALIALVDEVNEKVKLNESGKQPQERFDLEQFKRADTIVRLQRNWSEINIPSISYLSEGTILPPDLEKEIAHLNGFDKRFHFLKLADKEGVVFPDGPQYPRFRLAATLFTRKFRKAAENHALSSNDYSKTSALWKWRLDSILEQWRSEEKAEMSRPGW